MKKRYSLLACVLVGLAMIIIRLLYTEPGTSLPVKVTTWDALGYYLYLPSSLIYHDDTALNWFPSIDERYELSGGNFYQANRQANGRYVFKYLGGIAVLQAPFFLAAHALARLLHYPEDGFSAPYQYAVAWGCLFYVILSIFLLRRILLRYYSDAVVALSICLLVLATNLIQYVAIDAGQSHGYLFPLYVLLLFATQKWQETEQKRWSLLIGLVTGIAAISRPTETIMILVPLLWLRPTDVNWKAGILRLKNNPVHLLLPAIGICLAVSPQLLYWKHATGSWVYDVGSKWDFLNPHFRVLFGWEKGWFVYTPVTLLFVAGLFLLKNKVFKNAVITFCVLNIYIIIAWHIWRYGGSYSCRALVQSYPVFALPLCAGVEWMMGKRWKWIMFIASIYLIGVNLFQIWQYNRSILHYDDMNFAYYRGIYLNPSPDELTMSLLDTKSGYPDTSDLRKADQVFLDSSFTLSTGSVLLQRSLQLCELPPDDLLIRATIHCNEGLWASYLAARILPDTNALRIRLFHPLAKEGRENRYAFFLPVPKKMKQGILQLSLEGNPAFNGKLLNQQITCFRK